MKFTRRRFLQASGAVASAAAVAGPAAGANATSAARETAMLAGDGGYLVVGEKGVLVQCGNYHDAVRWAGMLRNADSGPVQQLRCSPDLMRLIAKDTGAPWANIDGMAMTPDEVTGRSFEMLRRARNPDTVRAHLRTWHINDLRARIDENDGSAINTQWYACSNNHPVDIDISKSVLLRRKERARLSVDIHPCTERYARQVRAFLDTGAALPTASGRTVRHMTADEHDDRIANDIRYALVASDIPNTRASPDPRDGTRSISVAIVVEHSWLFRPDHLPVRESNTTTSTRMSPYLAATLEANGYVIPGFYRNVAGVLHHIDEFDQKTTAPRIGGRRIKFQNRHS